MKNIYLIIFVLFYIVVPSFGQGNLNTNPCLQALTGCNSDANDQLNSSISYATNHAQLALAYTTFTTQLDVCDALHSECEEDLRSGLPSQA